MDEIELDVLKQSFTEFVKRYCEREGLKDLEIVPQIDKHKVGFLIPHMPPEKRVAFAAEFERFLEWLHSTGHLARMVAIARNLPKPPRIH